MWLVLADTVIQIETGALITGLTAAGAAVASGLVGMAKIITGTIKQLHAENREDRTELMGIVKSQWNQLNNISIRTKAVQKKVGAENTDYQEDTSSEV